MDVIWRKLMKILANAVTFENTKKYTTLSAIRCDLLKNRCENDFLPTEAWSDPAVDSFPMLATEAASSVWKKGRQQTR